MSIITTTLQSFYRKMQKRHPGVLFYGDTSRREIALTFDDGPHPRDTPQVLDVLAKHEVHATFFLVGQSVERYPHLVKEIHQAGHQLALHCYHHIPFPLEQPLMLQAQLRRVQLSIAKICGVSPDILWYVRPPYGLFTKRILSMLNESNNRLVLWNSMPLHFIQPVTWTINQILEETVPGSIMVLHDGHGHGRKVAHIIDTLVPTLKALEFDFIKIEDMKRNNWHGK